MRMYGTYSGVYGDAYPRLHAYSLGLRADRVNGLYDDQTGAFPPGEPVDEQRSRRACGILAVRGLRADANEPAAQEGEGVRRQ